MRLVIDTNVLVSALRSRKGASFRLMQLLGGTAFQPVVSTPLCLEYEDVLRRPGLLPHLSVKDIEEFLDYFLSQSVECRVHFLWRPMLPDPKDDLLLEVALAGGAEFIVTHNLKDFREVHQLGIRAVTPHAFLSILEGK